MKEDNSDQMIQQNIICSAQQGYPFVIWLTVLGLFVTI